MDKPEVETGQNRCRNCGATLRGEYCHHCGQREGRGDLHFADAAGEVLGDLFTWDSRFWRTLFPLVFRPGFLTAEFIAGRRARYVPPFRLYIIISFVLFLVLPTSEPRPRRPSQRPSNSSMNWASRSLSGNSHRGGVVTR